MRAFLNDFTNAEVVKAYTILMKVSEPQLCQTMAAIEIESSANTLEEVAKAICEWCEKVRFLNHSFSLEENLENALCIVDVDETDTAYNLLEDFFYELKSLKSVGEKA